MNYGYIRVSTDKQTVENQRFEIMSFCERENIVIDQWIEETISGVMEPERGMRAMRLNAEREAHADPDKSG
jgi:DNA invertase Pin-like site-specific DNA recombinase